MHQEVGVYILNTPEDQQAMLGRIGVPSVEELLHQVPEALRLKHHWLCRRP